MSIVQFKHVDIIFGDQPKQALKLLDEGLDRDAILEQTGHVLGVADATLEVEKGEICVLMGLSGSGKSTLLRAVNGLNKVTRGEVLIDDQGQSIDLASCDGTTLRNLRMNRIAMVFQQFALLPWRTVAENVGLGLELRGVPRAQRAEIVDEKLEMVGLSPWANKYAHELSGGMQQRVGLARAFATDADILLMDEPFSALDPLIRNHLQDELLELQEKLHKTILFVSHDLDEALKIGSRIAIMESGRIVQLGTAEEIVLNPANEYVTEFVAHMNPVNVLRATTIMAPLDSYSQQNGAINLQDAGLTIKIDANNRLIDVRQGEQQIPIKPWSEHQENTDNCILTTSPDILMKTAIEIRHVTGYPVLLQDNGQLIGIIGDEQIYRGILQRINPKQQ